MIEEEYYEIMDRETIEQDFDDIDFYGQKIEEDCTDSNIIFE